MLASCLRELLSEGGLAIETGQGGPGTPVVLRTIIQIDASAVTFADPALGADDPDVLARHRQAVKQALAPVLDTLIKLDSVVTMLVFLASALISGLAFIRHDAVQQVLAVAAVQALMLLAKRIFPGTFARLANRVIHAYLRRHLKRIAG